MFSPLIIICNEIFNSFCTNYQKIILQTTYCNLSEEISKHMRVKCICQTNNFNKTQMTLLEIYLYQIERCKLIFQIKTK